MKKFLCIVFVLLFGVAALSACGGGKKLDAEAAFQSLLTEVTYAKELTDLSANAPYYFENMPQDAEIKLYRASGSSNTDQLIMVKAKDADGVKAAAESVGKYLDGLKKQAQLYTPEEMQKLNNAVIFDSDNYLFVCITEDLDTVHQILGD